MTLNLGTLNFVLNLEYLTLFSKSHHSLTLNISQTALSVLCAQLTSDLSAIAKFLLRLYISFILFIQALS